MKRPASLPAKSLVINPAQWRARRQANVYFAADNSPLCGQIKGKGLSGVWQQIFNCFIALIQDKEERLQAFLKACAASALEPPPRYSLMSQLF
ncbi:MULTISPECIES: hypothetical protein [unclassified Pantoea]|uniref:hypothetical protein n=1 Tax=unclassified Pantoea TaxID=2630326 RepID=UPI00257F5303|nr:MULTISPECIES: hypothetical protein [unclassified Pantoea]MDU5474715.1 hypothetical protein [Pantoea sp.]